MITYASATLLGCTIITDDGRERATTWRNAHASSNIISRADFGSLPPKSRAYARSTHAAFLIVVDCQAWIYARACAELISENKATSMYRVAMRIQKIERAMTRLTSAPVDRSRDVDTAEYDGFVISRRERMEMTSNTREIAHANDDAFYDWTHARGLLRRGFSGVQKQASIPSLATITRIDSQYTPVRARMMAERMWKLRDYNLGSVAAQSVRKYYEG